MAPVAQHFFAKGRWSGIDADRSEDLDIATGSNPTTAAIRMMGPPGPPTPRRRPGPDIRLRRLCSRGHGSTCSDIDETPARQMAPASLPISTTRS